MCFCSLLCPGRSLDGVFLWFTLSRETIGQVCFSGLLCPRRSLGRCVSVVYFLPGDHWTDVSVLYPRCVFLKFTSFRETIRWVRFCSLLYPRRSLDRCVSEVYFIPGVRWVRFCNLLHPRRSLDHLLHPRRSLDRCVSVVYFLLGEHWTGWSLLSPGRPLDRCVSVVYFGDRWTGVFL